MNDFTWREVSEKERAEISVKAKEIIDSFAAKLEGLDLKEEPVVEREINSRDEEGEATCQEGFSREIMFSNAKEKNADSIIGEKKKW